MSSARVQSGPVRRVPLSLISPAPTSITIDQSDLEPGDAGGAVASVGRRETFCAFAADAASERLIRDCISEMALEDASVHRGDIAAAIAHFATHRTPKTLLVDISDSEPVVERLQQLAEVCEPIVTVLAVGDRNDVGLFRDLLEAGVSNYLVKPLPRVLLRNAIAKLLGSKLGPSLVNPRAGQIVAVMGTHGAVGASTIAANLAWGLANRAGRQVGLVDLDLSGGVCDLLLGVHSNGGLREALERPQRVDELFVERALIPCGSRLSLLSSHETLDDPVKIDPLALAKLIGFLRQEFHFVVLDVPRGNGALLKQAVELANVRVLVAGQSLVSVRDVMGLRGLLKEPRDNQRNLVVLNRHGEPGTEGIARAEIEQVAGVGIDAVVPFDARCVVAAANSGQAFAGSNRPVARAIAALVDNLAGRAADTRHPWWQRSWRRAGKAAALAGSDRPQERS